MANKFIALEDAANQLGISKERLNELREAGDVRAYRDGASFKFRSEDIDKLAAEGIDAVGPEGSDLTLGSGLELSGGPEMSDLDLDDLDEPTVAAETELGDMTIAAESGFGAGIEPGVSEDDDDTNDSILLSEAEFGDSQDRPPSTIIGRSQLSEGATDDDLDLTVANEDDATLSDVKLADDVIDETLAGEQKAPASEMFENLEELEIDLEAESSRILEEQDIAAAQQAAKKMQEKSSEAKPAPPESSFALDLSDDSEEDAGATGVLGTAAKSGSEAFELASDDEPLELELVEGGSGVSPASGSDLKQDDMDDMVLDASDDEGFSLSAGDSGINLSPSDSGLALDDGSFPSLGGSVLGSSIDLGSGASEVSLEGSSAFESSPDFNLQPTDELDADDEEDSSQIIALDAMEEVEDDEDVLVGEAVALTASGPATAGAAAPITSQEAAFPIWIVGLLGVSSFIMIGSAIMATDLLRSMWAWEETYSLSSPLIEAFLGITRLGK